MCADLSFKIMREDTVLSVFTEALRQCNNDPVKAKVSFKNAFNWLN